MSVALSAVCPVNFLIFRGGDALVLSENRAEISGMRDECMSIRET